MSQGSRVLRPEIMMEQSEYSQKCMELIKERFGDSPTACTVTFGCQQNEADTELIDSMLANMGFSFVDRPGDADLIIYNTCAIREHAEMRALGNVGASSHHKRSDRKKIICLCGCMAQRVQMSETVKKSYPYVDILFGTFALYRFPQLLYRRLTGEKRVFDTSGDEAGVIIEDITPLRKQPPKAWLSIMYGCNNYCAYCVVPYVRGRERSRSVHSIVSEFETLVRQGYKDITLLGQNVNSYGNDFNSDIDFAELLKRVNSVPGDFRVRFMTSHPKDATPKLFDTMADCDKICHSIHLPVQAGSNRVLSMMNRGYTAEKYLELVKYARSAMPDITITSDIIVGFPGETEEDFEETVKLLKNVRFDSLFTFIFSRRPGTRAYDMPDGTSREDKQRRFDRLMEVQNSICREINETYLGKTYPVLVDGHGDDGRHNLVARTEGFKLVHLTDDEALIGQMVDVKIDKATTWALFGKVVHP